MAVNKRKILEAARKYAQRGAKQKALKEYTRLLRVDGADARLRLEVGDAHRRWGEIEEAIEQYTCVAVQYCDEGFDARAVAVYKQILNLAPKRHVARVALADLYKRMGLQAEAIAALQTAADGYESEGQQAEVLELLRKLAQLDPENVTSRSRVAEMLAANGREADAVEEYRGAAEVLAARGETEQAAEQLERALALAPQDAAVLVALATNARASGAPEGAVEWASRALEHAETEPALELLCDVYRELDDPESLADATRRLAKCYRDRGDEDAARGIMQRLPEGGAVSEAGEPDAGDGETGADWFGDPEDLTREASEAPAAAVAAPEPAPRVRDEEPTRVLEAPDFLAEAAAEGVGDALDPVALETEGLELDGGLTDALADSLTDELTDRLVAELSPENAGDRGASLEPVSGASDFAAALSRAQLDPGEAAPSRAVAGEEDSERLLAEANVYLRYGKVDQALGAARALLADEPGHRGALECLGSALAAAGDETAAVDTWLDACERAREEDASDHFQALLGRIAEIDPTRAAAVAPLADPSAPSGSGDAGTSEPATEGVELASAPEGEFEIEFEICEVDAPGAAPDCSATAIDASSRTAAQVGDTLAAADACFQQGRLEEAARGYRQVLALAPQHPSALVRLGEIENGFATPTRSAQPPPSVAEDTVPMRGGAQSVQQHADDSVDLQAEWSQDLGGSEGPLFDPHSLEPGEPTFASLFESFKRGVSETLADGDYETRYDLAIAYKEMGLLEDAMTSFQACVSCPSRGLDSLQLLAQCAIDLDRPSEAVHYLEQALSGDELEPQRRAGLYFDLARAFTASGEPERARSTYETVSELAPSFPGLAEAVAALFEREDAASDRDQPLAEGAFESLDDVLAEVTARDVLADREPADDATEEPEPEADAEAPAEPKKRRKKISFV